MHKEDLDNQPEQREFSGNIYIFYAFDVGDDINLEAIEANLPSMVRPLAQPKYFKNYHIPLSVELPHPHTSSKCISTKIYNFGAVSFIYKISFNDTLRNVRKNFNKMFEQFQEQSISDMAVLFKKIKPYTQKATFFQTSSSYVTIQVDPQPDTVDINTLLKEYGGIIASTLRFETETLSENQKNEILESAASYFRGDLFIIDTDATFAYLTEYEELLDFFEFANIQQLELQFFDRLLDQKLNIIYENKVGRLPIKSYLPLIGTMAGGPMAELGKLKVDISVITERLESTIKLMGEPYFFEIYNLLAKKLALGDWKHSIDKKLKVIEDIEKVYQNKIDVIRGDTMEILITVLIAIEVFLAIFVKH